jgi:hypothetical protein
VRSRVHSQRGYDVRGAGPYRRAGKQGQIPRRWWPGCRNEQFLHLGTPVPSGDHGGKASGKGPNRKTVLRMLRLTSGQMRTAR